MKIYGYDKCGTCRKAYKWLEEQSIPFEKLAIREIPPNREELASMLDAYKGDIKKLFNTSGQDYRNGGWKDKITSMSTDELLDALAAKGNLIKRPFVIYNGKASSVGFKDDTWRDLYKDGEHE